MMVEKKTHFVKTQFARWKMQSLGTWSGSSREERALHPRCSASDKPLAGNRFFKNPSNVAFLQRKSSQMLYCQLKYCFQPAAEPHTCIQTSVFTLGTSVYWQAVHRNTQAVTQVSRWHCLPFKHVL